MYSLNQFVVHNRKIPTNPLKFEPCNPHSPENWMSYNEAKSYAEMYGDGWGVGFVFTRNDPYSFLDIDHCLINGEWSPLAVEMYNKFDGAYWEQSMSGEGLHCIFTGVVPEHSCKNSTVGMELYTEGRYVALTGTCAVGDVNADMSHVAPDLVTRYFPPKIESEGQGWSDRPVTEWDGYQDDDELIKAALRSKSGKAAFGIGVTFKDLWTSNDSKLATIYPSQSDKDPYDRSSADAALALMLSFWTGKNHERIKRLMTQSSLVRDKWNWHKDYLNMTVTSAVNQTRKVYKKRRNPDTPCVVADTSDSKPVLTSGHQFMGVDQQLTHFAGCVYIQSMHRIFTPQGMLMKPEVFNASYGGYEFTKNQDNSKTTTKAWEAFIDSQLVRFPKVNGTCFKPTLEAGEIIHNEGMSEVNTYVPIQTSHREGDVTPFLNHLRLLLPDERDRQIYLSYIAALVQYPGIKFQWCTIMQGAEGNGKTFVTECVRFAVGRRYSHSPNVKELVNGGFKFNFWLYMKLFVSMEELHTGGKFDMVEQLKPIVTNSVIEFQQKGGDQFVGDNTANIMANTNHKDSLPINDNNRRFAIFYCNQQSGEDVRRQMGGDYFPILYHWVRNEGGYEKINHFLRNYNIPDEFNPAGSCHRAPVTTSTSEAINMSLGAVEQEIKEVIEQGRNGFREGWASSIELTNLLKEMGYHHRIPQNKRRDLMSTLGYRLHSGLKGGRVNSVIPQEGGKPRLYVLKGHPYEHLLSNHDIWDHYCRAQGYIMGVRPIGVQNKPISTLPKPPGTM